jgi:hypothetical protein
MLYLLLFIPFLLLTIHLILQHELTIQARFEERTRREWDALSEEDRLASGQENMYC